MFDVRMSEIDEHDAAELEQAVISFNIATTGHDDARSLGCVLRDDTGTLLGGLAGFTWGGYGMIDWLWVREDLRHHGLGARLVRAAEDSARVRGCRIMRVNSHTFQAPPFYDGLGYTRIGSADGTPVGHGEVFFAKRLDARSPSGTDRT